ncbi:MAG: acyl-CoA thioesterase [Treponemataceae bacterium]
MKHVATTTVRSYECDAYAHVNNAVYLNYLEYGRMEFLHAAGFDYHSVVKQGLYLYVTHVDIYYKGSALLDDKLFIETYPSKRKAFSGEFKQKIYKEDSTLCVEATVTWACVSKDTGRPSKIPAEFSVDGLNEHTEN